MNNPVYALIGIANLALTALTWAIIARAVLSWFKPDPTNFFVQLLNKVTNPVLRPLERVIPSLGGLDITPLIAIVLIQVVQNFLPRLVGAY